MADLDREELGALKLKTQERQCREALINHLAKTTQALEEAIINYSTALEQVRQYRDELVTKLRIDIEAKSDRWRRSGKGVAAKAMADWWEDIDLTDTDFSSFDHVELLEDAPDNT